MTLSEQIAELLSYYINGETNRRCKNDKNGCFYSGTNSINDTEGCIVGRLLSAEDRIKADNHFNSNDNYSSTVTELIRYKKVIGIEIPKIVIDNDELFLDLQSLHDVDSHFIDGNKLSQSGEEFLNKIIIKYDFESKDFEKLLYKNLV